MHGSGLERDELNSSCIGADFKAEVCLQSIDCIDLYDSEGKSKLDQGDDLVWLPAPVVANYRLE